jgi:hypothetical protein
VNLFLSHILTLLVAAADDAEAGKSALTGSTTKPKPAAAIGTAGTAGAAVDGAEDCRPRNKVRAVLYLPAHSAHTVKSTARRERTQSSGCSVKSTRHLALTLYVITIFSLLQVILLCGPPGTGKVRKDASFALEGLLKVAHSLRSKTCAMH